MESAIVAVGRLKTLNEMVSPEDRPKEDVIPPPKWPTNGKVELNHVSASYEYVCLFHHDALWESNCWNFGKSRGRVSHQEVAGAVVPLPIHDTLMLPYRASTLDRAE